jgi:hypothetical protein
VAPLNDAPEAHGASFTTRRNTALTRALPAADVDDDQLAYTIVTPPTKGTVTVNQANGTFTYRPSAGRTGTDSFRFRASDGRESSQTAKIDIRIQ